jgi:hypothetical protein
LLDAMPSYFKLPAGAAGVAFVVALARMLWDRSDDTLDMHWRGSMVVNANREVAKTQRRELGASDTSLKALHRPRRRALCTA